MDKLRYVDIMLRYYGRIELCIGIWLIDTILLLVRVNNDVNDYKC